MPSPDERSVGDDDGDDFPLQEGSFPERTTPPEPWIGSASVPPRGGGVSSEKMAYDFFLDDRPHIEEVGHRRANMGSTRQGARPRGARPLPREQGVGPLAFIFGDDFSLLILRYSVEFQDFWSCAE